MGISMAQVPSATCVVSDAASGKTAWLASRACELSHEGGSVGGGAAGALVLCASAEGARVMRERVRQLDGDGIEVSTPIDMALSILGDPLVVARLGRLRLLSPFEESVLFEDIKTCGCKRGRLRDLVAFLERGMSDMADDDPAWVKTAEERLVLDLMQGCLEFTGGVLRSQAASVAMRELAGDDALLSRFAYDHVLVDDFDLMARSSQILASMLALRSITLSAGVGREIAVGDPYPNPDGVDELERTALVAKRVELSERYRQGSMEVFMEEGIQHEFARVVQIVRDALDRGTSPERVLVVCGNGAWRANARRALEAAGVPVRSVQSVARRIRFESCGDRMRAEQREAALRRIASDAGDSLAWRTFCGLDDAIAASAAMSSFRKACEGSGLKLADALRALAVDGLPGASAGDPRYAGVLKAYEDALACMQEMMRDANVDAGTDESSVLRPESVFVGSPDDALAMEADLVVFGGFVNGIIPSSGYFDPAAMVGAARERAHRRDIELVERVSAIASDRVVFTGFTGCGLEVAERLKLHIARIRLKDGVRVATIEPSELLSHLGLSA